jgi:uncharacterized protein YbbC (DUF1343 family)
MKEYILIALYAIISTFSCNGIANESSMVASQEAIKDTISNYDLIVGAERIAKYHPLLKDKKVACVVNHTSLVGNEHLVDTLLALDVNIVKLFSPEHGLRGIADAGEEVTSGKDEKTQLPVISLYGNHKKPTEEDLDGVEIVVFDLQDVGVRFYTYISTITYVMEACAELNIPVIILDRPNINRHYIDGPVLDPKFTSFVGLHPVPVVYGMTIGEYALMVNGEKWLKDGITCELTIIECLYHENVKYYEFPVAPSPNLPNEKSMYLYPSLCFFEPTIVSVGRGTSLQFQQYGDPTNTNKSYSFTPAPNLGAKTPKHNGETCYGVDLSSSSIGSLSELSKINIDYLFDYYNSSINQKEFFTNALFFDKLAGTDRLRNQLINKTPVEQVRKSWEKELESFKIIRKKYLLYN